MAFHVLLEQILDRLHDVGCIAGLIGAIGLQEICQCSSHRLEVCIRVGWIGGQVSNAGRCSRCSCISCKNGKQGHCGKHLGNLHCSGERSEPMVQLSHVVNLRASSCADLEPQTNQMQTYMHRISEGIVQKKERICFPERLQYLHLHCFWCISCVARKTWQLDRTWWH